MMEERRKQPHDCLHPEEWREMHDFMAGTTEYRKHLDAKIDELVRVIEGNYSRNEKRIRSLEQFRYYAAGAVAVIVVVLIPIAMTVLK